MAELYDRTEIYDLFDDENKYQAVKKHWETILDGKPIRSLLDVSIGTGSLTLPLAELGISLSGSDLNENMLKKCGEKAEKRGLSVHLRTSDFRRLKDNFTEQFDCVGSTGNSLPYVNNTEILCVLEQMDSLIKEGGYLYFDMRNWDKILKEKNRFYLYNPVFDGDKRINLTQVWDYNPDGSMTFNLLYTFEKENALFQKEIFQEHYYPVPRRLLLEKLQSLGYKNIQLLCHPAYWTGAAPEDVDWYCVTAQKGTAVL